MNANSNVNAKHMKSLYREWDAFDDLRSKEVDYFVLLIRSCLWAFKYED